MSTLHGFKNTLKLLKSDITGRLLHFKCCKNISNEIEDSNFARFVTNIENIIQNFENRFHDFGYAFKLADIYFFPLICTVQEQAENCQEELAKLQFDFTFNRFENNCGAAFWASVSKEKYLVLYLVLHINVKQHFPL